MMRGRKTDVSVLANGEGVRMTRRTKIVATIGPATSDPEQLYRLLASGVDVARLNFSHGSHATHAQTIKTIRSSQQALGRPVTILQDLQGPKIRTGPLATPPVHLTTGNPFTLTIAQVPGDENLVSVDYSGLPECVEPGNRILLDDGNIELQVTEVGREEIKTKVINGGLLNAHKGINLPGAALTIPGFTAKDRKDLRFGLQHAVDAIAVSFVRTAQDIQNVRDAILEDDPSLRFIPIIAKLERPEALQNLEDIITVADGVMVARGDLGVEMSPQEVPIAQKKIIDTANEHGKVVITATQMLDSMIHNPRPTRAEASDVANAIFDGSDAVMLSGETASGDYPTQAVAMMDAIIHQAEMHINEWGHWKGTISNKQRSEDAYFVTLAARELAHDRNVAGIAVFTQSGRTAQWMSKARPEVSIFAFTPKEETYRRMGLYWGVAPYLVRHTETLEEMLVVVEQALMAATPIQAGQQVVVICGFPVKDVRPTNLAMLHTVGDAPR